MHVMHVWPHATIAQALVWKKRTLVTRLNVSISICNVLLPAMLQPSSCCSEATTQQSSVWSARKSAAAAPKNAKSTPQWEWSTAEYVQRHAEDARQPAKQLPHKNGC
jgi:hypothetical protein